MSVIIPTVGALGELLGFVVIPLIIIQINRAAIRVELIRRFTQVPMLLKLTIGAGIVQGIALCSLFGTIDLVSLELIFADSGPWDISLLEFLFSRVNPFAIDVPDVIRTLLADLSFGSHASVIAFSFSILILAIAVSVFLWPSRRGLMAISVCVLITLSTCFLMVYLAAGSLWMLNKLNFLAFLVPLFLFRRHVGFFRSIP